jgi:BMFP domain-containing protein YqiC
MTFKEIRYAYLLRLDLPESEKLEAKDMVAVRARPGYCPLLGLLQFLEQKVGKKMDELLDHKKANWS